MKKLYRNLCVSLTFIFLLGCGFSLAQNNSNQETKHQELKNYLQWSTEYGWQKQFDSATKYDKKALRLVLDLKDDDLTAIAQLNHAKISYWKTNTEEAKKYLNLISNTVGINDSIAYKAHVLFSHIHAYKQNHKNSLKSAINAESILLRKGFDTKKDSLNMMDVNVLMGSIHKNLGNYSKANEMYDVALNYSADEGYGSYVLFNKSGVYKEEEKIEKAISYAFKALDVAKRADAKVYLPTYYLALSDYYLLLKKADSANYFARIGLIDNKDCHLDGLRTNVGKAELMQGNFDEAINFFNNALEVENVEIPQYEIHNSLRETYIQLGEYKKAIAHNEIYLHLKDSTDALRIKQEVIEITEKYESDKKELQIEMLNAKNDLNSFVIEKQRNQIIFIGVSLVLAIACIGLIAWFFQKQKRQKQLLYSKNVQLARRLQEKDATLSEIISTESVNTDSLDLDQSKKNKIVKEIEKLVGLEFYLDQSISLAKMAKMMNTNTTYLSKVVNVVYQKNFTNFLNDYRISYTLKELEMNPSFKNLTIEHIADKSGFSSSSVFYNSFKKFTGLTPSYYIKKKLQQTQ